MARLFTKPSRIVIKLGTGMLTLENGSINNRRLAEIASEVGLLKNAGLEVILVSSGAIGLGMDQLKIHTRPQDLAILQSCAAVGQSILTERWRQAFAPQEIVVAQILLTQEDIKGANRHIAVRNTLDNLLAEEIVPIINENDTISNEEIRFGDNDILSAMVASLSKSDLLCILSSIPGLIDIKGTGKIVDEVLEITEKIVQMAQGTNTQTSVGGMISKIEAAKLATSSGTDMIIADGSNRSVLTSLLKKTVIGTLFHKTNFS